MFLTAMPIGDAAVTAGLGYAVVFFGLILLMLVVMVMGKIMSRKKAHAEGASASASAAPAAPLAKNAPAPGSAGEVKLHDVSDRDAAMIMAIVADKLGRPLNELRFKSIKEVK